MVGGLERFAAVERDVGERHDGGGGGGGGGAGRHARSGLELHIEFWHDALDGGDHLGVGGQPAGADVVGRVGERVGCLQQSDRPPGVVDVAEVEPVVGSEAPGYAGEVDGSARRRGVDELRRREGEVR